MDEKDTPLAMDQTVNPALVDEPRIKEEPSPDVQETVTIKDAKQESDGPVRNEKGQFVPKGDKPADEAKEAPPASEEREATVPIAALKDERRKRQELEDQIAALQRQFEQQKPKEQPAPAFWDDPDNAISARIEQATERAFQRIQQQQHIEKINASELAAKAKYDDYQDAFRAFQQAASLNPLLIQQMTTASDPGEFAYTTGKRSLDLGRVGSIDELLKQERAKWEAEVKAAAPAPSFPRSTVTDGSAAPRSSVPYDGPTPDSRLLAMG